MKAKIQSRLADQSQRSDLKEIAPLGTPFVLMIDPSSNCNFKCRFCPTGYHDLIKATGRRQMAMPLDLFQKIIDDLQEFPSSIKTLRLYKEGEPLMNKRFAEMVAYAKKSDKIDRIDTTTNGALLFPETSDKIINAGIDQINISVNGVRSEQFLEMVRSRVDFDSYLANIRYLYEISRGKCEIYVKAIEENLSEDDQKRFLDLFGNYADRIFFEHIYPAWPGFDSDVFPDQFRTGLYGDDVLDRNVCPYIFYLMMINSDGSVSACVQDWERHLVLGSVVESSVRQVWLGDKASQLRLRHLDGKRRDNPTCGMCGTIAYGVFDNIDSKADEIKNRLANGQYYERPKT